MNWIRKLYKHINSTQLHVSSRWSSKWILKGNLLKLPNNDLYAFLSQTYFQHISYPVYIYERIKKNIIIVKIFIVLFHHHSLQLQTRYSALIYSLHNFGCVSGLMAVGLILILLCFSSSALNANCPGFGICYVGTLGMVELWCVLRLEI